MDDQQRAAICARLRAQTEGAPPTLKTLVEIFLANGNYKLGHDCQLEFWHNFQWEDYVFEEGVNTESPEEIVEEEDDEEEGDEEEANTPMPEQNFGEGVTAPSSEQNAASKKRKGKKPEPKERKKRRKGLLRGIHELRPEIYKLTENKARIPGVPQLAPIFPFIPKAQSAIFPKLTEEQIKNGVFVCTSHCIVNKQIKYINPKNKIWIKVNRKMVEVWQCEDSDECHTMMRVTDGYGYSRHVAESSSGMGRGSPATVLTVVADNGVMALRWACLGPCRSLMRKQSDNVPEIWSYNITINSVDDEICRYCEMLGVPNPGKQADGLFII